MYNIVRTNFDNSIRSPGTTPLGQLSNFAHFNLKIAHNYRVSQNCVQLQGVPKLRATTWFHKNSPWFNYKNVEHFLNLIGLFPID